MIEHEQTVYCIVDQDESIRDVLVLLLSSMHLNTQMHRSVDECLRTLDQTRRGCIVLRLPVQQAVSAIHSINKVGVALPIVLLVNSFEPLPVLQNDTVFEIVRPPVEPRHLRSCIKRAVQHDFERRNPHKALAMRMASLTPREQRILKMLLEGQSIPTIARSILANRVLVEAACHRILEKLGAKNTADLVRIVLTVRHDEQIPSSTRCSDAPA